MRVLPSSSSSSSSSSSHLRVLVRAPLPLLLLRACPQMPFFFVSAADGTNVVQMFEHAIKMAWAHKKDPARFVIVPACFSA